MNLRVESWLTVMSVVWVFFWDFLRIGSLPFLMEKLFLFSWQFVILWILGKGNAQWHCMKLNFGSEQRTEILINLSFGNMQFLLIGKSSAVVCSRRPSSFSLEQKQHHTRWKWPTGSKQLRSTRQTKKWFIKRLRQSQNIVAEAHTKKKNLEPKCH